MLAQMSIGENLHDFSEGTFAANSNCAIGKLSVSHQPSGTFFMRENDSSEQVDAKELSGTDTVVSVFESLCIDESSMPGDDEAQAITKVDDTVESSGLRDDKGKDTFKIDDSIESSTLKDDERKVVTKVDDASETKCSDRTSLSLRRQSSCKNKLDQDSQKKKLARNCRKRANKKVLLDLSSLQFTRRRRSSLCKQPRSTVWGLLGNITPVLEQNGVLDINPDKPKRLRIPRGIQGNTKREKSTTFQKAEKCKEKRCTPTGPISLKVKIGKACLMNVITATDDHKDKDYKAENCFSEVPKKNPDMLEEVSGSMSFESFDGISEKMSDMDLPHKDSGRNQRESTSDDLGGFHFQGEVDKVGATSDNRVSDSGTSPDSEVINVVPDAQVSGKDPEELPPVMLSPHGHAASGNGSCFSLPWKSSEKGRRKDELHQIGGCSLKGGIASPGNVNAHEFSKSGLRGSMGDGSCSSFASTLITTGNESVEGFLRESLPSSRVAESGICCRMSKVEGEGEGILSSRLDVHLESPELPENLVPRAKGQKLTKSPRSRKLPKSRSEVSNSSSKRENASKKKGNQDNSGEKRNGKKKGVCDQVLHKVENHHETGFHALSGIGEAGGIGKGNINLEGFTPNMNITAGVVVEECMAPRNAWVSCDDCHKWRRIPAALADKIEETNCRWVCKDNMDGKFSDCSILQEKSNAEINAELEISDASCEEDPCDTHLNPNKARRKQSTVTQKPWVLIKSNMFLHRRRKTQTIDEIMVCSCKPPSDGRMGCGQKCLNRMLNIECNQGTCPCGEFCSNQQFQKRKYAKLKSLKCGKKGYGLQLLGDVSEGQFLIEYVGEVLDMHSYEARQREYAANGHKHFYFMTLNGSEVIDACAKGNLGRFINHSCDPNCRTEKWMVNGEVCIGIFALKDIKKGEEVTFDYNYVRVFGAAAKKCVCSSSQCRGYIGGDPLNSEVIVQGDSDDEYPEPFMACDGDEMDQNINNVISVTSSVKGRSEIIDKMDESLCTEGQADVSSEEQTRGILIQDKVEIDSSTTAAGCSAINKESIESTNGSASTMMTIETSAKIKCSVGDHSPIQPIDTSLLSGDVTSRDTSASPEECSATDKSMNNCLSSNRGLDTSSLNTVSGKSLSDVLDTERKLKSSTGEGGIVPIKSHCRTKISGRSSSVKNRKPKTDSANVKNLLEMDNKLDMVPFKPKRLMEDPSSGRIEGGRFEAVQEKLNELLDLDGGISKRKDASRGYLKLLLLTAASGDSGNGEAIQSNRDLSMILDALLKTKSRTVLVDIINKNGLQMLHNIMKRYRKEYIKIPILRKLLKVLEYLATREILTSEHINGGPRCPGVESFRDSILTLTEHIDKQVHQIARNFRDRWIPRCFRRYGAMDRDACRTEFHRTPNHDKFSASHYHWTDQAGKSSEPLDCITKVAAADADMLEGLSSHGTRKRKSRWDQPGKGSPDLEAETNMAGDTAHNMDEDAPPGFSSPLNGPMLPSDTSSSAIHHKKGRTRHQKCPYEVEMGHLQQRFISRLPVAYGVPISIVQQFGTHQSETSESWIVAPGMPFQPFPPLPTYPRDKSKYMMSQAAQKAEQDYDNRRISDSSQNHQSTSGVARPDLEAPGAINQLDFQRARGYNSLGRKYFRQQKSNNSKLLPPWVRMRNGWGSSGNNIRNGTCQPGLASGLNELKSSHNSQDGSSVVQTGNTFHQHLQQQNWH